MEAEFNWRSWLVCRPREDRNVTRLRWRYGSTRTHDGLRLKGSTGQFHLKSEGGLTDESAGSRPAMG